MSKQQIYNKATGLVLTQIYFFGFVFTGVGLVLDGSGQFHGGTDGPPAAVHHRLLPTSCRRIRRPQP